MSGKSPASSWCLVVGSRRLLQSRIGAAMATVQSQIDKFFRVVSRFGRSGKRRQWIKCDDDLQTFRMLAWCNVLSDPDRLDTISGQVSCCQNAFRQFQRLRKSFSTSCKCGNIQADYWEVRECLDEGYTLSDVVSQGLLCPACETRPRLPWRSTQYVDALDTRSARDAADVVDSFPARSSRWRGEWFDDLETIDDGSESSILDDLQAVQFRIEAERELIRRRQSVPDLLESRDQSGALVFASCGLGAA